MHAYRFILKFENDYDFVREVDVLADQSFEDFYYLIAANLELDKNKWAAFYKCDHSYRKKKEILKDKPVIKSEEEHSTESAGENLQIMADTLLNDIIDDPHQRLILEYDEVNHWTFYIEMLKIYSADDASSFPKVVKSIGEKPNELKPPKVVSKKDEEDPDLDDSDDAQNEIDDSAAYRDSGIIEVDSKELDPGDFDDIESHGNSEEESTDRLDED